jgi:hypothetical protein
MTEISAAMHRLPNNIAKHMDTAMHAFLSLVILPPGGRPRAVAVGKEFKQGAPLGLQGDSGSDNAASSRKRSGGHSAAFSISIEARFI